jgi:hypothetical protein
MIITLTNLHNVEVITAANNCYFFTAHCLVVTSNSRGSFYVMLEAFMVNECV